ncbi:hypothetical protein AAFF_G00432490 [Aldrovandia affinis]|uniref:Uncharacterized protein n=1 Tax=Aldrovandia affinis TaxID=143900 RepID=A0AAD7WI78_9TELE|nr:hypothetical protein AAFF_G00432490 [Aldrovandia affinis]
MEHLELTGHYHPPRLAGDQSTRHRAAGHGNAASKRPRERRAELADELSEKQKGNYDITAEVSPLSSQTIGAREGMIGDWRRGTLKANTERVGVQTLATGARLGQRHRQAVPQRQPHSN